MTTEKKIALALAGALVGLSLVALIEKRRGAALAALVAIPFLPP